MNEEVDPMRDMGLAQDKMLVLEPQGVLTPSDPAKDLCARFIPQGDKFYELLYRYDLLTTLVLNSGTSDGSVLKYIAPFIKAYGATDYTVSKFYAENMPLTDGAPGFVRYVDAMMPVFFNTMMYEHASDALCAKTDFPLDAAGPISFPLDEIEMSSPEARDLRRMAEIIVKLSLPADPMDGTSDLGLSREEVKLVSALDKVFKGGLFGSSADRLMDSVGAVGLSEKAYGLLDIRKTVQVDLDGTMYVGSEPNDFQAMGMVREGGGLALSFNGSEVNIEAADVAVVDDSCLALTYLSAVFFDSGSRSVVELAENWNRDYIKHMD